MHENQPPLSFEFAEDMLTISPEVRHGLIDDLRKYEDVAAWRQELTDDMQHDDLLHYNFMNYMMKSRHLSDQDSQAFLEGYVSTFRLLQYQADEAEKILPHIDPNTTETYLGKITHDQDTKEDYNYLQETWEALDNTNPEFKEHIAEYCYRRNIGGRNRTLFVLGALTVYHVQFQQAKVEDIKDDYMARAVDSDSKTNYNALNFERLMHGLKPLDYSANYFTVN